MEFSAEGVRRRAYNALPLAAASQMDEVRRVVYEEADKGLFYVEWPGGMFGENMKELQRNGFHIRPEPHRNVITIFWEK